MAAGFGRSGQIGLAELVEALVALRPHPEVAGAIASSLGITWIRSQSKAGRSVIPPLQDNLPPRPIPSSKPPIARPGPQEPNPVPSGNTPRELKPVRSAASRLQIARTDAQAATSGPLAPADPRAQATRPPYRPLFRDSWWRALVRAMFATPTVTAAIDLRLVAKHLRTGRPLERPPWIFKSTLRRGVILILDRSESMQPFWRDESELIERCKRVVGGPAVRSYWVEIDPWSEDEPRLRWLDGKLDHFAAQTPVVIVSDFELGKEITPRWPLLSPWLPLIRRVNSAGSILLAMVPVSRSMWPPALLDAIPRAIPWDHTTSTGAVRRSVS